jgi:site-specific DNA-methyltransferase (adenine-specific)
MTTQLSMDGAHMIATDRIDVFERLRPLEDSFIEELAQDFIVRGQLQPIVVLPKDDGRYLLLAGAHRLAAAKLNGSGIIGAVFNHELDPIEQREIELAENCKRKEMPWKQRELARAELHEMRMKRDPTWTQERTAQLSSTSRARVAESVQLAKMMEIFPEIGKAKSARQALSWMKHKAKSMLRVQEVSAQKQDYGELEKLIILGDAVETIKAVPDESFHTIITDPPFGIDIETIKMGTGSPTPTQYEDSGESYEYLLTMAADLYRVIKKDGWLVWFLGHRWYRRCYELFQEVGFAVDEIPIVWNRSAGHVYTMRPDRFFARGYDIALHCRKGEPEIVVRGKSNVIDVPPVSRTEKELFVERPVELYAELIRRLTVPGEIVADFFVGSGSCPAAAASMGRRFFGCEIDPARRAAAIQKVKAHLPS